VGKPRGRREAAVDLLQVWNWKEAARNREGWRQNNGEVMAQKQADVPQKKKKRRRRIIIRRVGRRIGRGGGSGGRRRGGGDDRGGGDGGGRRGGGGGGGEFIAYLQQ
jgi:uncharacterized membrane protein YgcG